MRFRRAPIVALAAVSFSLTLAPDAVAATVNVTIADFTFFPRSVLIAPGDTVTWKNAGATSHTVTSDTGTFDSGAIIPGSSFSFIFPAQQNSFPYHCSIHPTMTGAVFSNRGTHAPAEHVLTLNAADFIPTSSGSPATTTLNDFYRTNGVEYMAPIHLATGALLTGAELLACNTDLTLPLGAQLFKCQESTPAVDCQIFGTMQMAPQTNCSFVTSSLNEVVDNVGVDYVVVVNLVNTSQRFRTVRIYYKTQISTAPATASFSDVPTTHPFYQYIEALVAAGVTAGCSASPPQYCPDAPLTRGQMAVFMARALGLFWPN